VRQRTFATDLSASFPVEGTPAVVIGCPDLLKKSPEEWVITASHEMFHVFQATNRSYGKISTLGISSQSNVSWQLTFPFPYSNADVMRLIHLRGYTLWLVATSKDDADAKYNMGTAIEAAGVYRTFLDRLAKPQDYLYSEFQEWNEGVAAYTEYRFAEGLPQLITCRQRRLEDYEAFTVMTACGKARIRIGLIWSSMLVERRAIETRFTTSEWPKPLLSTELIRVGRSSTLLRECGSMIF
jgi:hypothetical protein